MEIRYRALITRIQTMRTSSMVAVGTLLGILLILYIKETGYRRRAVIRTPPSNENKDPADVSTENEIGQQLSVGFNEPSKTTPADDSDDSSTMIPTTSTTVDYDDFENEDDSLVHGRNEQQMNKELAGPRNIVIGHDEGITTTQSVTTIDYNDVNNVTSAGIDQAGQKSNNTKSRVSVDKSDDTLDKEIKSVQTTDNDKQDREKRKSNVVLMEMKLSDNSIEKAKEARITDGEKKDTETGISKIVLMKMNLPDSSIENIEKVQKLDDEKEDTNVAKSKVVQMEMKLPPGSIEKANNVDGNNGELNIFEKETQKLQMQTFFNVNRPHLNKQENVPVNLVQRFPVLKTEKSENSFKFKESGVDRKDQTDIDEPTLRGKSDGVNYVKNQVQMLSRKYPATVNEAELPRQNETYTQRLRNKLVQTGRYDLIENKKCKKRLPKCIIIGVMKAGTEAFSTFLGVHSKVAMQFGYSAMVFFNSKQYQNGLDWYRERMMCSTNDQITMEKSPQYFSSAVAPKRIHNMDPEMKLIILVREPISRAHSHFLQQQYSHPERLAAPTFEECVYDKRTSRVKENSPYIQQSRYSVILKRWLQYFSYKQILIIDGDTFRKNPTRSLRKAENFLGIDHSISQDRLYFNKDKGFYCLKINSTIAEDFEMSCFGSEKGRPHPAIDPEVESALLQYFRPYNKEFMKITGMKMNWK